ncbi:MAG TPA: hypothetical protein VFW40_00395 [Capsulimonadaceae bacterium]|nr:hypothetical protein [Capsulimonadaceae bacterium]
MIHAVIAMECVKARLAESGIKIRPVEPSKLKACPFSPATKETPPTGVPSFVPAMSL